MRSGRATFNFFSTTYLTGSSPEAATSASEGRLFRPPTISIVRDTTAGLETIAMCVGTKSSVPSMAWVGSLLPTLRGRPPCWKTRIRAVDSYSRRVFAR